MSNENEQTTPIKRKRGNPNFGKPKVQNDQPVAEPVAVEPEREASMFVSSSDSESWLKLYTAILGTYNSPGVGPVKQAATYADMAYQEFRNRYPK